MKFCTRKIATLIDRTESERKGKQKKSNCKSILKFYTRDNNQWNQIQNKLYQTRTTQNFETIIFCKRDMTKDRLIQDLQALNLSVIGETVVEETKGVFCAQVHDKNLKQITEKISTLGSRNLGCINRIVLPREVQLKQRQQDWGKAQIINIIQKCI